MKTESWKKTFAVVYTGQAFSFLGSAAVQFAIIWWLTVQTESAVTLTTAAIVGIIPNIFLSPFAGVAVDRFNRRTVMIFADALVALSSVVLGFVFVVNKTPPVAIVYAVLFVRGVGTTFHGPALQAAVPMLVPAEMLTKAGGWGNLIASLSYMLGPVLGAALMGIFSIVSIMLVDIVGATFAIISLLFVRIPDIPQTPEKIHLISDIKQGIYAIRDNKPLKAIFLPMVLTYILFMPLGALFPLLILTHFNGTAFHNSIAEFAFAGGLLVSSLAIGVWGGMKKRFLMVSLFIAIIGLASSVSGILPAGWFAAFAVCSFIMGCAATFINVPLMAYTQETIAADMLGKVLALMMTASTIAMPVGLLVAGPVGEAVGIDRWFFWSGILLVAMGVYSRLATKKYDDQTRRLDKPADSV